jgi:CRISPR-associated protein Cas1
VPFSGREKHPPPDPVNAAVSLGYSLLTNLLTSQLDAVGFDPYLGFLHEETYGHPALALDLAEPFRAPVVDRMVIRLFNLKVLEPDDFQPHGEGGLHMTDQALRRFFAEWERVLQKVSVREAIRQQLEQLARVYRRSEPCVQPWRWMAR